MNTFKLKEGISSKLTDRESEILYELLDGYTNNEIGKRLEISRRTVEVHRKNIMNKIGAKTGMDLAVKVLA